MDEYDIPKPVPARPDLGPPTYPPDYGSPTYPSTYGPPNYQGQPTYPNYPPGSFPTGAETTLQYPAPLVRPAPSPPPRPQPTRASHHAPTAGRLRGTVGGLLTSLGLFVASLAVTAFVLSTLVLNPDRPGQVVKAVLSTSAGRSVATEALATAIRSSVPGISAAEANKDAAAIIASPGLASSLGSSKANVSDALLAQLKQVDPTAAAAVSKATGSTGTGTGSASPLTALPRGLTSATSKAHSALHTAEIALLVLAVALVGIALLVGPSRDRILVRVGYWAIAASAVQLLIWYGLPRLLGHFTNDWAQVAAAALRAGGTGLLTVFGLLAGIGVAALVIGYSGRMVSSRR